MELTLGPVLFEWKREETLRFYDRVADMPVDRVYLGEVVCSKKRGLTVEDVGTVADRLTRAGKKVVLSSLAVVSNEEEIELTRSLVKLPFPVEANDMSVFNMVDPAQREVSAGPHITTYNVPSIEFLKGIGVGRVTFPVELSGDSIAYNIEETGVRGEVFAHGRVPLAFSWRCYTSRAHGLNKTDCRHDCVRYPDGMVIKNLEGTELFTINGPSILSAATYTLCEFVEDLSEKGVSSIRISPQYSGTERVAEVFKKRIEGSMGPEEALEELREVSPAGAGGFCNGWWLGAPGKDYFTAPHRAGIGKNFL